jgi:protein required for attachment to host cells
LALEEGNMKQTTTWVLTADGALARVYQVDAKAKRLLDVRNGAFAAANLRSRDIDADKPGQGHDRVGHGQRRMQPRTDSSRHAKAVFAGEVAEFLRRGLEKKAFDSLIIAAAPQALGDLRAALAPSVKETVKTMINKDLVHIDKHELPKHLGSVLLW